MIASKLAQIAKVRCQEVTIKEIPPNIIKVVKQHLGNKEELLPIATLARNIFPKDYEITYGQRIVNTPSDSLTLEEIEKRIRARYYSPEDILDSFAEMIVFDAWIGNMDRHHENWGVSEHFTIRKGQRAIDPSVLVSKRHFSPLYDHGSSLLFELSDDDIERYLGDRQQFKKRYILGKKYTLIRDSAGEDKNIFEIIWSHIERNTEWGRRLQCLSIAAEIIKMPHHPLIDYSDKRRELLYYSLVTRQQILEGILDGEISF